MSEEKTENLTPTITYRRAKFWRRIFANLLDLILLIITTFLLFAGVRGIADCFDSVSATQSRLVEMRIDSSLYRPKSEGSKDLISVASYLEDSSDYTAADKFSLAQDAIFRFADYAEAEVNPELKEEILNAYNEFRLEQVYLSQPYFINVEGEIVENPDCKASKILYFQNIASLFLNDYCEGCLVSKFPEYVDLTLFNSRLLFLVELPISFAIAGILIYLVPIFIFRRGRKTFGKALYKIGVVDSRVLNPTWKRSIARFLIFYLFILILSLVTFAVPAIISTTMMGFSKKRQGFADYMLDLQEIDTTGSTIFFDIQEAEISEVNNYKKPVDFESISRL